MQQPETSLPPMTEDLLQIQVDLKEHGVALLANALSADLVNALDKSLTTLAESERCQGTAFLEDGNLQQSEDGPNQRVFSLISKGESFRNLAKDQRALDVVRCVFASSYKLPAEVLEHSELNTVLLSSLTANTVHKGGVAMMKHTDQGFMPPATSYPAVVNVLWLLDDFHAANGATLVAPGSHRETNPHRFYLEPPPTVALEAPAGTAIFLDGRTWHGTGVNTTDQKRSAIFAYYCRPFMRQQENFALSLSATDLANFDDELLGLLGFKVWFTLGGIGGTPDGTFTHRHN